MTGPRTTLPARLAAATILTATVAAATAVVVKTTGDTQATPWVL